MSKMVLNKVAEGDWVVGKNYVGRLPHRDGSEFFKVCRYLRYNDNTDPYRSFGSKESDYYAGCEFRHDGSYSYDYCMPEGEIPEGGSVFEAPEPENFQSVEKHNLSVADISYLQK